MTTRPVTHAIVNRLQDRTLCELTPSPLLPLSRAKIEDGEIPTCLLCQRELLSRGQLAYSQAQRREQVIPRAKVADIVLYQSFGTPKGEYQSLARAAIVTQVNEDGTIGLCILNPTGMFFTPSVKYAYPTEAGCWSHREVPA